MGVLDIILGNSELKCAAGLAATPFVGVFGAAACEDLVEEALLPLPTKILKRIDTCPADAPPETCERLFKSVRVFEKNNSHIIDRLHQAQDILDEVGKALFLPPLVYPIVVGLEQFGYPLFASKDGALQEIGSFAADLLMSTAMFGAFSFGAGALAKKAGEAAQTRVLREYVRQITPMYFSPIL